jgi:hypothetical protein
VTSFVVKALAINLLIKVMFFQISHSSEEEDCFNLESEQSSAKYGWFESGRLDDTSLDLEDFRYHVTSLIGTFFGIQMMPTVTPVCRP